MKKRIFSLVLVLMAAMTSWALGFGDGSTKENAIEYDWENGVIPEGAKWYRLDLAPLYSADSIRLVITNMSYTESVNVSYKATILFPEPMVMITDSIHQTLAPQATYEGRTTSREPLVSAHVKEIFFTVSSTGPVKLFWQSFFPTGESCEKAKYDWEEWNDEGESGTRWYHLFPPVLDERNHFGEIAIHFSNWEEQENNVSLEIFTDCGSPALMYKNVTLEPYGYESMFIPATLLESLGWSSLLVSCTSSGNCSMSYEYVYNGLECFNPIRLNSETSTAHPAGEDLWYVAEVNPDIVPYGKALRMHFENQSSEVNSAQASLFFKCGDPEQYHENFTLLANDEAYIDFSHDLLDRIGWPPYFFINYRSENDSRIRMEIVPSYRDTIMFDTVAYVCAGSYFMGQLGELHLINNDTTWTDTVSDIIGEHLNVMDSIAMCHVYVIREPELYPKTELDVLPVVGNGAVIDVTSATNALLSKFHDAYASAQFNERPMYVTDIKWQVQTENGWQDMPYTVPGNATSVVMRYVVSTECDAELTSPDLVFDLSSSPEPCIVASGTCGAQVDNLTWTLTCDSVLTISGTGEMGDFADTYYVPWYNERFSIKTIIVEQGVTSIGKWSFGNCVNATSVTLPSSITNIGNWAFGGCQMESLIIPNSVSSIGNYAFYTCGALKNLTLPSNLISIGNYAFCACENLGLIEIPDKVASIGEGAFRYCSGLTSVTIPNSVTSIGDGAFDGCSNLTTITNYATIPQPLDPDGISVFGGVPLACTLYVPVESIALYQAADVWKDFYNILPIDSTEEVNYATLADIYNMAADSVFTLGAFDVVYVASYQNGANMYIKDASGSGVIYMPSYGLQTGDHVEAGLQGKVNIYHGLHEVTPITAKEDLTITSGEAPAPMEATEAPSLANVNQYLVYKNVSFSTDTAFVEGRRHMVYGTWNGQTITFYNQYHIGATLSTDKTYNITAVNSVYGTALQAYPLAVEEVSPAPCIIASGTCGAQGDNLTWTLTCDSVLTISGTGAMEDYDWNGAPWYSNINAIRSVIIENSVTSIGNGAFSSCTGLTSVTIPNSVTSIGWGAFSDCRSLTSIEIPNSVTTIESRAFESCIGMTSLSLSNAITFIGAYAFVGCTNLLSVTIPNSLTYMGAAAFGSCERLTSIDVEADNQAFCSEDGVLFSKDKTIIRQYPAGKEDESYSIPNTVKIIYNRSFTKCSHLKDLTIPNSVLSIGQCAFGSCSGLSTITIPNSVTSIESDAFWNCYGLISVEIPASVTNIEWNAFQYCSRLSSITNYSPTPQTIEADVFNTINLSSCTLYVPAQSLAAYKAADVWKEFGTILPIEGDLPIEPTEGEFNVLYIGHDGDYISSEEVTLHLPVAPVIEGFLFVGWQTVSAMLTEGIIIQAVYQAEEPTSAPAVYTNPANPAQKLIRNGNVYILRDDKVYTVTGQTVK